jgi:hypothetical protein
VIESCGVTRLWSYLIRDHRLPDITNVKSHMQFAYTKHEGNLSGLLEAAHAFILAREDLRNDRPCGVCVQSPITHAMSVNSHASS